MRASAGAKVPLRGYERMMSMTENGSMKIVHIMTLRAAGTNPSSNDGDTALQVFLRHLPEALVLTFNKHPRMRAKQLRGEFAMAQIQPPVTMDTILKAELLEIRQVADTLRPQPQEDADDIPAESWEKYAETESNIPLDRYAALPFYVRVWHDPSYRQARLMLFSDHYMSDGISGLTVLNDIVAFASELSCAQVARSEELPLRPSLYDMWMTPQGWKLTVRKWVVSLVGKHIFKSELRTFTPVVPLRSDQADFALPPTVNSSSALFGQGTSENMQNVLQRCKQERVTFFGVFAASVVTAFYIASGRDNSETKGAQPFKLSVEVDYNMRKRVATPAEEDHVGAYLATNALEKLSKKGVDMDNVRFWDLARQCKQELEDSLHSFLMPLTLLFLDEHIHSQIQPEFIKDLAVPHSVSSDVNISSIGRYPYKTTHSVRTTPDQCEDLTIDSVHVYNSSPNLGSAAIMYVISTNRFSFSMMHKYEDKRANTLFAAFVACVEHAGKVDSEETMVEVAKQVHAIAQGEGKKDRQSRMRAKLAQTRSPQGSKHRISLLNVLYQQCWMM